MDIKAPRAWYKPLGVMVQPEKVESINFETKVMGVYMKGKGFHHIRLSDVELMWPTGLKDKNGKEIYEGDIGYTLIGRYSDPKHIFLSVVKCDRCFWEFYEKERDTPHEIWPNDQFEIIGNIYEHPHLLEGRDEA